MKIEMKWLSQAALAVYDQLVEAGYAAYFVGGAIRDALMGLTPSDVDLTTSATPDEVEALFKQTIDLGKEHGTIIVRMLGESIEVTTFRTESMYVNHRRPEQVAFVTSLVEDLQRRDFTMNAIASDRYGQLTDPFKGVEAIRQQQIIAVGEASERFHEDALRMMRAIRFMSTTGFTIEANTLEAIREHAALLQYIAVERIKVEWDKLWLGKNPNAALRVCFDAGLHRFIPSLAGVPSFEVPTQWIGEALDGYAWMIERCDLNSDEVSLAWKMSRKEKEALKQRQFAVKAMREEQPEHWMTYCYSDAVIRFAHAVVHGEWLDQQTLTERRQQLPIQGKQDLMIDGKQLLAWTGEKPGKWLGDCLHAMEYGVVVGEIEHTAQALKEWGMRYVNERVRVEKTD